jgi:ribosomal protein S18 acetylase RimI-like enzyme
MPVRVLHVTALLFARRRRFRVPVFLVNLTLMHCTVAPYFADTQISTRLCYHTFHTLPRASALQLKTTPAKHLLQFEYRLTKCPHLSLGIFTSLTDSEAATAATSAPVYSGAPKRKAVLLGHIVATMTDNQVVTDNDMHIPSHADPPNPDFGHKENGRTVCIHSLAVLPDYQGKGLGTTLMKAYLDRLENQDVADRVALISHEHLVPFYENLGFSKVGESKAEFGGGGWIDMVAELKSEDGIEDDD